MDNNIYALITNHLKRMNSPAEEQELFRWLEECDENKRFFSLFLANLSLHDTRTASGAEERRDRMLSRLNARIDEDNDARKRRRQRRKVGFSLAVAAIAALGIFLFLPLVNKERSPEMQTFVNNSSIIKAVTLGDRTRICLKPRTSIRFNVTEIPDRRIVEIDGEGYFDVAKDSLRPLTVLTKDLQIRVLGTAFTVHAAHGHPYTEIVLERGTIRLLSEEGSNLVCLSPNQRAVFNSETQDLTIDTLCAMPFVSQQYNLISLTHVTLDEIVRKMETTFGPVIEVDGGENTTYYDVNFLKSDSLQDVLTMLECLTGRHFSIKMQ